MGRFFRLAAVVAAAAVAISGCAATAPAPTPSIPSTRLTDATGRIAISVPTGWTDVNPTPQDYSNGQGPWRQISAAPDLEGFTRLTGAGVVVSVNLGHPGEPAATVVGDLADYPAHYCTGGKTSAPASTATLTGTTTWYRSCQGTAGTDAAEFVGTTTDGSAIVQLDATLLSSDGDQNAAFAQLLGSLQVEPQDPAAIPTPAANGYLPVALDCGCLFGAVPADWSDISFGTSSAADERAPYSWFQASSDLAKWNSDVVTPGAAVYAFPDSHGKKITDPSLLGPTIYDRYAAACTLSDSGPIDDNGYHADYRIYTDCDHAGGLSAYIVVADDATTNGIALLSVRAAPDQIDAIEQTIFDSLDIRL